MFGLIKYRKETLQVLRDIFRYEPNMKMFQRDTFKAVTKQIKKIKGNKFDAAIAFMFTQIESGSGFSGGGNDWKSFRKKVISDAEFCSEHAVLEITKETISKLLDSNWEILDEMVDQPQQITAEFDNLIDALVTILLSSKSMIQNKKLFKRYIASDEAFGYVGGFIDGYLQTRTREYLEKVGQDDITITNTVLSIVFQELEFNENYLPIERMRLLQNSMDTSFMAAMIKGGNAAFELVKQEKENFDMLHWIDHFNEYSEQSK